jgi:uncharacterized alpha-E superfamily protein
MLSRVAENIYWLSRYVERAENTARLLRVNAQLVLDTPRGVSPDWEGLVEIAGLGPSFSECCSGNPGEREVVRYLIGTIDNPGSILYSLAMARENARTVREVMPRSAWEALNELFWYAKEHAQQGISKKGRDDYLEVIIAGSQRLVGLFGSVMYRDDSFHFLRIGRNLERADMTTRILDVRSTDLFDEDQIESRTLDALQWISVLKSLSGYQIYRRVYETRVRRAQVLEFLFQDTAFPRAVTHCLDAVEESIGNIGHGGERAMRRLRSVARKARLLNVEEVRRKELHVFIDEIQHGVMQVHDEIAKSYFLSQYDTSQTQTQAQTG